MNAGAAADHAAASLPVAARIPGPAPVDAGRGPGSPERQPREHWSMCSLVDDEPEVLDVRSLAHAQRHQKIFEVVGELDPGESFILVNDHDPKPLRYQLDAEHPREFSWTYLNSGPTEWRVQIGKLALAA
jgi:uncharacterized protein (DUF2249 family)